MDIIDAMRTRRVNPDLYSLERILSDVPTLNYDHPMLYALFLHHNATVLSEAERAKVVETIDTLKYNRSVIDNINMNYMTRHKV